MLIIETLEATKLKPTEQQKCVASLEKRIEALLLKVESLETKTTRVSSANPAKMILSLSKRIEALLLKVEVLESGSLSETTTDRKATEKD